MSNVSTLEATSLRPVPRSKGCITCTARKTRCDGRRPTCEACERRKQSCRGYRRGDFVFMNEGWMPPGVHAASHTPASTKSSTGSEILPPLYQPISSDRRPIYASFFLSQFNISQQPPETLVMINSCQRYFGLLLDSSPFDDASNPLPHAAEALVMNHFGKLNASPRIIHESIAPYTKALRSMSTKISNIQRVGMECMDEEEVIQLIFTCLYLAFWELAMNPRGTAWQKHVRGLANILEWRGPHGFESPRSLQVITLVRLFILLESVSSKRSTFLSEQKWHRFRNLHPSLLPWPTASKPGRNVSKPDYKTSKPGHNTSKPEYNASKPDYNPSNSSHNTSKPDHNASRPDDNAELEIEVGPKHYLDFILDRLIIISNLTAEFSNGLTAHPSMSSLQRMQAQSESVLADIEPVLAYIIDKIGGNVAKGSAAESSPKGPLWGKPLEYNLSSLCRTAAITLRLLTCDLIREQQQLLNPPGMLLMKSKADIPGGDSKLAEHRAALLSHVDAIVNMIPYSSDANIFGVAPLCFVPAFRIAKVVLSREQAALRAEWGRDAEIEKCLAMEIVIQRHLEFVASKKISIKVDI